MKRPQHRRLRVRQKLGKYRIDARLATGGFADVFRGYDTVEGVKVALKVPNATALAHSGMAEFRKEVRLTVHLDHPNILAIKNADIIDGIFVIAYPLGERSLADRLKTRLSVQTALDYTEQLLDAVAHAHERGVIHCDIKPENVLLFEDESELRLADFGIGRFGVKTLIGSGSGTVGYVAPEQALGKLSFRSDVFSLGLLLYRMFTGHLPEWPFEWPPAGHAILRRKLHPDMIAMIRRSIEVNARKRFPHGSAMLAEFQRVKRRAVQTPRRRRTAASPDWRSIRLRAFRRAYGKGLETRLQCRHCDGPVSEAMQCCPWCGVTRDARPDETSMPATCPRCKRGVKLDWAYCAWCYGGAIGPISERRYPDLRYVGRCSHSGCPRRELMPFMRYCPWCRHKVRRKWPVEGTRSTCRRCGWGVVSEYWDFCPWCSRAVE